MKQHRWKYQAKILMKVQVLKLKSVNSKLCGSQSFRGSLVIYDSNNDVMYCYVCRKAGSAIAGKTEFVDGKKVYT
jgi:hypothetical protein